MTWAAVALGGTEYAAACMGLSLFAAVGLFAVPLPSTLRGGGAGGVSRPDCGGFESITSTLVMYCCSGRATST